MVYIKEITLDFDGKTDFECITAVQGDNKTRFVKVSFTQNNQKYTIPQNATAAVRVIKPDGHMVLNNCDIEYNSVTINLTEQILSTAGICNCEITLFDDNGSSLTSANFLIKVRKALTGPQEIKSSNEFSLLTELITDSKKLIDQVKSSLEKGEFIGDKGEKGEAGEAGFSPTIEITEIDNGSRVSITDINGTKNFDVYHGNGINEYELTYYDTEPTESQQLLEKATILTIMNDTADHIVYINYDDGKHPASIYQYGGAIYFYFIHPNEKCWFEISYFPDTDFLQYGKFSAVGSGGECNLPEIAERTETELFPEGDYPFALDESSGFYMFSYSPSPVTLVNGCDYKVLWDGNEYYCTAVLLEVDGDEGIVLGNLSMFDSANEDTKEPFIVMCTTDGSAIAAYTTDKDDTNKIGFYKINDSADEGKFLQVIDGKAAWVTIELAEDGGF